MDEWIVRCSPLHPQPHHSRSRCPLQHAARRSPSRSGQGQRIPPMPWASGSGVAMSLLASNQVNPEVAARSLVLAVTFSLVFAGSASMAQTLRNPLPACQSLKLSVPPDTECFDDVDRDGKFQYSRGDRAYTVKTWIQYQWNLY